MSDTPQTIVEAMEQRLKTSCEINSQDTHKLYRIAVGWYERFLSREGLLSDFNDETFAEFMRWRGDAIAHETLRGECNKLLALWRWCAGGKRRWIDPPEVASPKIKQRTPKALTREQLTALWKAAERLPGYIGRDPIPNKVFWPALLYTLWDTSERIGAVYQLDRDCIDLAQHWINVPAELRKGGQQARLYKIRESTALALGRLLDAHGGSRPFAIRTMNNLYVKFPELRKRAGLPKWVSFHTIRRSHASHLTVAGGNARESLGHSTDAVTIRSYLDPRITNTTGNRPCDLLFDPSGADGLGLKRILRKLFGGAKQ